MADPTPKRALRMATANLDALPEPKPSTPCSRAGLHGLSDCQLQHSWLAQNSSVTIMLVNVMVSGSNCLPCHVHASAPVTCHMLSAYQHWL